MFEGKEIKFVHPCGISLKGIIVGCDRNKGATVIQADDPEFILYCNSLKSEKDYEELEWFIEMVEKEETWDIIRYQIERGLINSIEANIIRNLALTLENKQKLFQQICPFK